MDEQAIEIAQLNLLLRVLQQRTKLPTLSHNIRIGNSLVDGDTEKLQEFFGDKCREQKAFNWQEEFPEVFEKGGFDVIIGNPPYIRPHNLEEKIKKYLWSESKTVKAKGDIYSAFIEKGITLLKDGGLIAFIVPHTWLSLKSFEDLREFILDNCCIKSITFTPRKVFKDAQVETLFFVFEKCQLEKKRQKNKIYIQKINYEGEINKLGSKNQKTLYSSKIFDTSTGESLGVLNKVDFINTKLNDFINFFYGLKTADDKTFLTFEPKNFKEYKKLIRRRDFSRYCLRYAGEYVCYRPDLMKKNKATARPGEPSRFEEPKLVIMDIAKKLVCTFDNEGYYVKDALILKPKSVDTDLKYIAAIINSKLINFYYLQKFKVLSVAKNAFLDIPIPKASPKEQAEIADLVEFMLNLQKEAQEMTSNTDKHARLKIEIEKLDEKIDQLIYKLYKLTDEEIAVIEK